MGWGAHFRACKLHSTIALLKLYGFRAAWPPILELVILHSALPQLNHTGSHTIFVRFSYGRPLLAKSAPYVFVRFPYGFRTASVRLSYGFRTAFVRLPYGFRTVAVRFPYGFRTVSVRFPYGFRTVFVLFPYGGGSWANIISIMAGSTEGKKIARVRTQFFSPLPPPSEPGRGCLHCCLTDSYGFRTVSVRFPYGFRTVFVRFSYGFRTVFVRFSYGFRTVSIWGWVLGQHHQHNGRID